MLGKPEVARKRGLMAHTRGVVNNWQNIHTSFRLSLGEHEYHKEVMLTGAAVENNLFLKVFSNAGDSLLHIFCIFIFVSFG